MRELVVSSEQVTNPEPLFDAISGAEDIVLELRHSFRPDVAATLLLCAAVSRAERRLLFRFPSGVTENLLESATRSFLGALLFGRDGLRERGTDTGDIARRTLEYSDPVRKQFCVSTSMLGCESREAFAAEFGGWARRAAIALPDSLLGRVGMLAYEACVNAEEHGASRVDRAGVTDPMPVMRCFVARLHSEPGFPAATQFKSYFDRFLTRHDARTSWLELLVVDAGMGVAFPHFHVTEVGRAYGVPLYETPYEVERDLFERVLARGGSTKGRWGRVVARHAVAGEGLRMMQARLRSLGAAAVIRTGRSAAFIDCALAREEGQPAVDVRTEVRPRAIAPGTLWHLMVPLDPQLRLL